MLTTPGVRNVEDRFSAGGAKKSHTPGAATPTGSGEREDARTTKDQGVGSNQYEKDVAEQRPDVSTPSLWLGVGGHEGRGKIVGIFEDGGANGCFDDSRVGSIRRGTLCTTSRRGGGRWA